MEVFAVLDIEKKSKTFATAFTNKAKKISLTLDNIPVEFVNKFKYLGIVIDSKLKFTHHVLQIIDKVKKIYNKLQIFVRPTWGIHSENIRTIYHQVIEPIICYGASIWHRSLKFKYIRKKLLSLQRITILRH
jgi:hypothetical protein